MVEIDTDFSEHQPMNTTYQDTEIHFLNVGHGDCTIIRHASGRITMIDINNGQDYDPDTKRELDDTKTIRKSELARRRSLWAALGVRIDEAREAAGGFASELTDPVKYFLEHWPGQSIFRFILTHPDFDHIRGLHRLRAAGVAIENFWDTDHEIEKTNLAEADLEDWNQYEMLRAGKDGARVFRPVRGESKKYWSEDDAGGNGDGLWILAPTPELRAAADKGEDPNAHSLVLHLTANGIRLVLGGDATKAVLQDVFNAFGINLDCHIYKAAHHGRESGYCMEALRAMAPKYTIVSVGQRPSTDASQKYQYFADQNAGEVLSTRFHGDIVVRINSAGTYSIETEETRKAAQEARFRALAPLLGLRR